MNEDPLLKEVEHHQQNDLCKTRPAYRQGRNLTAIKVYSVTSESQHLCIYNVPSINLRTELKSLCVKYGRIVNIHVVADCKTEQFTECYHVHYERLQSARIAKRLLDNKSFYGGVLHVCYAPEFESIHECREKLHQRTKDVGTRLNDDYKDLLQHNTSPLKIDEFAKITKSQLKKKRKLGEVHSEQRKRYKHDAFN